MEDVIPTLGPFSKKDLPHSKEDRGKEARSPADELVSEEEERSSEHFLENGRKRLQGARARENRGQSPSPTVRRSPSPSASRRRPDDKTDAIPTLDPAGPGQQTTPAAGENPESGGKHHKGRSKTLRLKGVAAVTKLSRMGRGNTVEEPSSTCSKAAQMSSLEEAGWSVAALEQLELTDKKMLALLTRKFGEESRSVSPERAHLGGNTAWKHQNPLTTWYPEIQMF